MLLLYLLNKNLSESMNTQMTHQLVEKVSSNPLTKKNCLLTNKTSMTHSILNCSSQNFTSLGLLTIKIHLFQRIKDP